jgi:beta-barrel assembly-enhancing protease
MRNLSLSDRLPASLHVSFALAVTLALSAPVFAQAAPGQSTPGETAPSPPASTPVGTSGQTTQPGDQTPSQKGPVQTSPVPHTDSPDASTPSTSAPPPLPGKTPNADGTMPGVKAGSIEDVNAVGTRNIGARGMGNWYSTESEIKMGKSYAMQLEKSTKFITDPMVTEYINRIGQNIVKNSDCKVPFTIKVIDTDEINAMALPGGFFYVNSGLILAADEEAELAGVMAHETAHVCAHHAAREMTRANYMQIGSIIPMVLIGGWTGYGIYEAESIAIPVTFLEFSREFEAQADYLGIQYMYRAGYDPQAFITFFEKIQDLEKHKPGAVAKVFSDHPQTPDRIEHSQEEIASILPPRDEYIVTTSEFDDVKARLARIENKRRLTDGKNGQKPTLRRVSSSDPNSNSTDDERPTLHRRDDGGSGSGTGSGGGTGSGTGTSSGSGSGSGSPSSNLQ